MRRTAQVHSKQGCRNVRSLLIKNRFRNRLVPESATIQPERQTTSVRSGLESRSETATQRHSRHMAKESIVGVEAAKVRKLRHRTYGYMNGGGPIGRDG